MSTEKSREKRLNEAYRLYGLWNITGWGPHGPYETPGPPIRKPPYTGFTELLKRTNQKKPP